MNPEYDFLDYKPKKKALPTYEEADEGHIWDLTSSMDEEELAAEPYYVEGLESSKEDEGTQNYAYDPRVAEDKLEADSERDDVDLRGAFLNENNWADISKAVDKDLSSLSEYQVDPMDMDEYEDKSDYDYWAEDDEKDATLMYSHSNYLSPDETDEKVNLYINDPFENQEMPPAPPPSPGMVDYSEMASEAAGPPKPAPTSKTNPNERPSASFDGFDGYRHEYYRGGRRVKTKIEKPGTGVSPAANMRPGNS